MTNAETYAAMVEAYDAQRSRVRSEAPDGDRWGGERAAGFKMDPRRPLDPSQEVIASFLRADDVLVDVGGGAGRLGLPLALRCKEVINAEPSSGMRAAFQEVAAEAGITNVRTVEGGWVQAGGVEGDVCLTANVTYFVRDIVPFLRKLDAAAQRQVMICVNSVPFPNSGAAVFDLVYGEPQMLVPGHRELLPVLWDMGILPEVRVLPGMEARPQAEPSREAAIRGRLSGLSLPPERREQAQRMLHDRFDELFVQTAEGFLPRPLAGSRGLLITWETQH